MKTNDLYNQMLSAYELAWQQNSNEEMLFLK